MVTRRFSSIEPFVSTVCGIYRWQVPFMKGPSTRRFLGCLVNRPFTLGHRVGVVNPDGPHCEAAHIVLALSTVHTAIFQQVHLALSLTGLDRCQGLSAVAARRPDPLNTSGSPASCQPGGCLPVGSASSRRQLKDGSIGYECQHPQSNCCFH